MSGGDLTHLDEAGRARMVDVGGKRVTERRAEAEAAVAMSPSTADKLFAGSLPKGDALGAARLAGIMAAKKTPDLIPLCHPIALTEATVDVERTAEGARITASVSSSGRTGAEMEAMTAVTVAALVLYDMVKGTERGVSISRVRLLYKTGGASGEWRADDPA